jgi:hypothetical protein
MYIIIIQHTYLRTYNNEGKEAVFTERHETIITRLKSDDRVWILARLSKEPICRYILFYEDDLCLK